jgi:hypothetical protein
MAFWLPSEDGSQPYPHDAMFLEMLRQLARYRDVDLALGDIDIAALRGFFQQWMTELERSEH